MRSYASFDVRSEFSRKESARTKEALRSKGLTRRHAKKSVRTKSVSGESSANLVSRDRAGRSIIAIRAVRFCLIGAIISGICDGVALRTKLSCSKKTHSERRKVLQITLFQFSRRPLRTLRIISVRRYFSRNGTTGCLASINHDDLPIIYARVFRRAMLGSHYWCRLLAALRRGLPPVCWRLLPFPDAALPPQLVRPSTPSPSWPAQPVSLDTLAYDPTPTGAVPLPSPSSQAVATTEAGDGQMIGADFSSSSGGGSAANVVLNLSSVPLQQAAKTVLGDMIGVNYRRRSPGGWRGVGADNAAGKQG